MFASDQAQREFYEMMQTFEVVGGFQESTLNELLNPTAVIDAAEGGVENMAIIADDDHSNQEIPTEPRRVDASTQTDSVEAAAPAAPVIVYDYSWSPAEKEKVFGLIKALIVAQEKAEKKDREINSLRRKLRSVLQVNRFLLRTLKGFGYIQTTTAINNPDITGELTSTVEFDQECNEALEEIQLSVANVNTWKKFFRSLSCI